MQRCVYSGSAERGHVKTEWDYSKLAESYVYRPEYAEAAIDKIVAATESNSAHHVVCDIGAGVAHLTIPLAKRAFAVVAVEPNDEMRRIGIARTKSFSRVSWREGTGEDTGCGSGSFHLVTFGSSFNVVDRSAALRETYRILSQGGWFACIWNHRVLSDPLQNQIEEAIKRHIPSYGYGARREDQRGVIEESGLFMESQFLTSRVEHRVKAEEFVAAWRSHGTLARQSDTAFGAIVEEIADCVDAATVDGHIMVPYDTVGWLAQRRG